MARVSQHKNGSWSRRRDPAIGAARVGGAGPAALLEGPGDEPCGAAGLAGDVGPGEPERDQAFGRGGVVPVTVLPPFVVGVGDPPVQLDAHAVRLVQVVPVVLALVAG